MSNDDDAVQHLVLASAWIVPYWVHRLCAGQGMTADQLQDVMQEAHCALVEAARRFRPDRGVKFSTYAGPWIRRAVFSAIRFARSAISISERDLLRRKRIQSAYDSFYADHWREPTIEELVERTGLPRAQIEQWVAIRAHTVMLTEEMAMEDSEANVTPRALPLRHAQLAMALATLPPVWRRIVCARYGMEGEILSYRALGRELDLSHERVRQIEHMALKRLARLLTEVDSTEPDADDVMLAASDVGSE